MKHKMRAITWPLVILAAAGCEEAPKVKRSYSIEGVLITSLAFSPDGKKLLGGCEGPGLGPDAPRGEEVLVWTIGEDKEPDKLSQPGSVGSIAFSPDGKFLAVAGSVPKPGEKKIAEYAPAGGAIRIYGWPELKLLNTLLPDSYNVSQVAFSPDGKTLAATIYKLTEFKDEGEARVKFEGEVWLWDVPGFKKRRVITQFESPHNPLAYFPTGDLAVGDWNKNKITTVTTGVVKVFDVYTGAKKRTMTLTGHSVQKLAISPDGQTLAVTSDVLRLWDVATGKEKPLPVMYAYDSAICFSPDGKWLAISESRRRNGVPKTTISLWDRAAGKVRKTWEEDRVYYPHLVFSPDTKVLAAGGGQLEGAVKLWTVPEGSSPAEKIPPPTPSEKKH